MGYGLKRTMMIAALAAALLGQACGHIYDCRTDHPVYEQDPSAGRCKGG